MTTQSLTKKQSVLILLVCHWTTWRAMKSSNLIRQVSMTCAVSTKWGLVGTFQSSPHLASPSPVATSTAFWRMPGSVQGQTCSWCTRRMQLQWSTCFENFMPMPALDALRWRVMLRLVTNPRGSCVFAHFVSTWVVTSDHTSIISSVCITMLVMDHFMCYALVFVTKDQMAKTVARVLYESLIAVFGMPAKLLSDC